MAVRLSMFVEKALAAIQVIAHRFFFAFAFVFGSLSLFAGIAEASDGACESDAVEAVGKFFKLEDFYYPYPKAGGKLIVETCKPWPTDSAATIAAFVYDGGHPGKQLFLALVNSETSEVVSSYSDSMPEEDAVTRIGEQSVQLDTAPYILSKTTRAFGVVYDIYWPPCAATGGMGRELQLFVVDGNRIRPVLQGSLHTYHWGRETTDCFNPGRTSNTYVTLQVLKSASNGFFDLKLTARQNGDLDSSTSKSKRDFSYTVKYDGKSYDLSSWDVRFSCWYNGNGSTCNLPANRSSQ